MTQVAVLGEYLANLKYRQARWQPSGAGHPKGLTLLQPAAILHVDHKPHLSDLDRLFPTKNRIIMPC